ncbi:MAG: 4'-phosphopantetheinyl transferase superfamily protein [Bacilli bacterium]|nr:4'-phosphopantetheinyl transferase superfamily protein [Bacilli bacterium]
MIVAYIYDIKDFDESKHVFSKDVLKKVSSYKVEEERKIVLASSLILENYLLENGKSKEDLKFNEKGKPYIEGLFFNISHYQDKVLLVDSSRFEVGCDIVKRMVYSPRFAKKFFSDKENELLANSEDKNDLFTKIWAIKESYVKCTGEGISFPLSNLSIEFEPAIKIYRNDVEQHHSFFLFNKEEYFISIASTHEDEIKRVSKILK